MKVPDIYEAQKIRNMKIGETIVLIEDHRMLGWPYRRGQRFRIIGDVLS